MFTGYNSNIELDWKAFHVQTEDKVYAAFELGRISQRSVERRSELVAPAPAGQPVSAPSATP